MIDQLEELFTLVSDEDVRRSFLDGLTDAIADESSGLRVAATLRADFLDRPLRYADFGQLVKHGAVTIVGMSASGIAEAITQPAASVGVEVEPALVNQLVADVVDQPAALPLLQFTLTELFDRGTQGERRAMTLADYRELGGVEAAVGRRAEAAVTVLPEADRDLARRVFLRLVTVDDSNSVSRRRTHRSQLTSLSDDPHEVDRLLDTFGAARLLTFDHDPDTREPTGEVAHEALIQHWPRFRDWVRDAGDSLRVRQQIADAAAMWEENDRDDGDLARGLRLESALELAVSEPEALDPLEREFVAASDRLRTAEADAAAEAGRAGSSRANRRLQGLLAGVGLLLVIALVAGFFAVGQRNDARAANTEAELAKLISDSAAATADGPELSRSCSPWRPIANPEPATEQAVLNALGRSEIGNRTITFEPLDVEEGCPPRNSVRSGLPHRATDRRRAIPSPRPHDGRDHRPRQRTRRVWGVARRPDQRTGGRRHRRRSAALGGHGRRPGRHRNRRSPRRHPVPVVIAGDRFAATVDGSTWTVHDAETGEQVGTPTAVHDVYQVVMHPTGDYLAILGHAVEPDGGAGNGPSPPRRRAGVGTEIDTIETERFVGGVAFDDTTGELVAAVEGVTLRTFDTVSGDLVGETPLPGTSEVRSVSIRPDGAIVVASLGQVDVVNRHAREATPANPSNCAMRSTSRPVRTARCS